MKHFLLLSLTLGVVVYHAASLPAWGQAGKSSQIAAQWLDIHPLVPGEREANELSVARKWRRRRAIG